MSFDCLNQLFLHKLILSKPNGSLVPAKLKSTAVGNFKLLLKEAPEKFRDVWAEYLRVRDTVLPFYLLLTFCFR